METLWVSPVFVGLTRPLMWMGITIEYLSICFMVSVSAFILMNSFCYLFVYFPLHALGWLACQVDHHIFKLINKRWECMTVPNRSIWGCQSYDPM